MRVARVVLVGLMAVAIGACSGGSSATPSAGSTAAPAATPVATESAAGVPTPSAQLPSPSPAALTSAAVVQAFSDAGLEATSPREMTVKDFGLAPKRTDDATHFGLPSLCSDCGGRAFVFQNVDDLRATKDYYDSLGESSAMFFSWTFANEDKLVLVQLNGELSKAKAAKYGEVVAGF